MFGIWFGSEGVDVVILEGGVFDIVIKEGMTKSKLKSTEL